MKTAIIYTSVHHGNTKKIIDEIAKTNEVDLIDATQVTEKDLSGYDLIAVAGIDNKDVCKNANLDRKHFSKIQCDEHYHPKKKTVMALCIALHLDLEQSKDLMARADWGSVRAVSLT